MDEQTAQAFIRFGFGASPGARAAGDPRAALKAQLRGPDPGLACGAFAGLPSGLDALTALRSDNTARRALLAAGLPLQGNFTSQSRQLYVADGTAQIAWAAQTPWGFRERLVWFWANHFSVSIDQNDTAGFVGPMIREAIRPNVTGTFTDLVLAVERHPAMLRYLDNAQSVGPDSPAGLRRGLGLNENLGRECMELHTVGLVAGYSQADVTNMAKLLTGWSVAPAEAGGDGTGYKFRSAAHEPGAQTVLGRSFGGGEQAGIDALAFLSTYPTTYQVLARKLVIHFVADTPPPAAVRHLAGVLRETGGDLAATSAALVDLPQAWVPGSKLKTPFDYLISVLRAAPLPPSEPALDTLRILARLGQPLWAAPLPDGWPDQAVSWDGADAILARIDFAYSYAARLQTGAPTPGAAAPSPPSAIADAALGSLLRPRTRIAMAAAGSDRDAITLLFAAPEFQRR
jgi:uncharacterized protein (DUF1800 family)